MPFPDKMLDVLHLPTDAEFEAAGLDQTMQRIMTAFICGHTTCVVQYNAGQLEEWYKKHHGPLPYAKHSFCGETDDGVAGRIQGAFVSGFMVALKEAGVTKLRF